MKYIGFFSTIINKHKVLYIFTTLTAWAKSSRIVDCHSSPEQADKSHRYLGHFLEYSLADGSILLELVLLKSQMNAFVAYNQHLLMGVYFWSLEHLHGNCTACFKESLRVCWRSAGVVSFHFLQAAPTNAECALI